MCVKMSMAGCVCKMCKAGCVCKMCKGRGRAVGCKAECEIVRSSAIFLYSAI